MSHNYFLDWNFDKKSWFEVIFSLVKRVNYLWSNFHCKMYLLYFFYTDERELLDFSFTFSALCRKKNVIKSKPYRKWHRLKIVKIVRELIFMSLYGSTIEMFEFYVWKTHAENRVLFCWIIFFYVRASNKSQSSDA